LIDQHLDWMFGRVPHANQIPLSPAAFGIPHRSRAIYDPEWLTRAEACALALGFSLPRGTYLATLGPSYETRAEYRAFNRIGADMVGMSTVPECIVAAQLGIPVLAFSIVTNVANPDAPTKTDHELVLARSKSAQAQLVPLIHRLINDHFPTPPSSQSGNHVERQES
jgi:purine-nucleoside phosphorylase